MRGDSIRVLVCITLAGTCLPAVGHARQKSTNGIPLPRAVFETSLGNITLELDSVNAPVTVANFLSLLRDGYYNEMVFHRVIRRTLVQVGIMHADGTLRGMDHPPILNEADNHLHNGRGTIAMARGDDPQSSTTEFFINLVDNWDYNFKSYKKADYGYAVFGRVLEGLDVADEISRLDTRRVGPFRTFPKEMVLVYAAYIVDP